MKLVALMPVRNEDWILGLSLRAVLRWCDEVVVLNHASTDGTAAILEAVAAEFPKRVTVIRESDPGWPEMAHRQRLLESARERGATHMAIVDADEVLTGNLLSGIRPAVEALRPGEYLQSGMPCMWRSLDEYRTDSPIWSGRSDLVLAFADAPHLAWRQTNGYDHHHRHPHGSRPRMRYGRAGGVMHLQWASWRRVTAKHALYKIIERVKYPSKPIAAINALYSLALDERGLTTETAPAEWWDAYADLRSHARLESEPWQESEARRLVALHGAEMFGGLDLLGVA